MKILQIALKNLNSLRGEHLVALDAPPLADAGIFAITGPTGSGKSTLLDAVTLALYGRASRYGRAPNPEDMMSRHTGECRAEVEFEVASGRYRAAWHLHRSRGRSDGKVQPPKRYVYDASGAPLNRTQTEADTVVADLTGLDYDRFLRSALLAQGEFARFLRADAADRAALLESLTNTTIYSELSELAHAEAAHRAKALELAEAELGAMAPLSGDGRAAREAAQKESAAELASARAEQRERDATLAKAGALADAIAEEAKLAARADSLAARRSAAAPLARSLDRHRAAQPFATDLAALEAAKRRCADADALAARARREAETAAAGRARALRTVIAAADAELETARANADRARTAAGRAMTDRDAADRWLAENRMWEPLPVALPDLADALASLAAARQAAGNAGREVERTRRALTESERGVESARHALSRARDTSKAAEERQAAAQAKLDAALNDRGLDARRAEIERLGQLRVSLQQFARAESAAARMQADLAERRARLPRTQAAADRAERALQAAKDREALLARHLADAKLYASLADHRADLRDGSPCPLCGALEHPHCTPSSTPTPIAEIESEHAAATETTMRRAEEAGRTARALAAAEAQAEAGAKQLESSTADLAAAARQIAQQREGLGIDSADTDIDRREARLRGELTRAENAAAALATAERASLEAKGERKRHEAELAAALKAHATATSTHEAATEAAGASAEARDAREIRLASTLRAFGVDLPEPNSEAALRDLLSERAREWSANSTLRERAEQALKAAQADQREADRQIAALRTRRQRAATAAEEGGPACEGELDAVPPLDAAEERLASASEAALQHATSARERDAAAAAAKREQDAALAALSARLDGSAFRSVAELLAARLESDQAAGAERLLADLARDEQQLAGAREALGEKLQTLREGDPPTGEALERLQAESARAQERIESLAARLADTAAELRADDALRARQRQASAKLSAQRAEHAVWRRLGALIGSHDGRRFRVFAQSISLDILVAHANRHLARLGDRYQLARSPSKDLELEIIDLYQAGAIRPMASLSGGESFLASLALALGLSDLAGRNVRIDSLFIDEGFGTLDAGALDTALSALESLRLQDKTVGVISHVELLKERIAVGVAVHRGPDGSSHLQMVGR